ncbi:cation-transporting ATPase G [Rathayibacter tanaceti]|uniref:Cadmium-translocating P-type ATPase n=2 Tax=Rathayibacter tanaceti TaxID=1671680 RepID=A0AAE6RJS0_9MICO|nr:cation-translocating P-type ATPase [Rathayibacter tanaceti]QHC54975.1 cadmium-translocating P-type ATPase [Rathayibacter tanaceti]TCO38520.1 cation-transporting ATPase G [Rathayibacter tanaceti]
MRSPRAVDACCAADEAPSEGGRRARPASAERERHDHVGPSGSDHDQHADDHDGDSAEEFVPWWQDRSVLIPLAAGVLLLVGYLLEWTGLDIAGTIVLGASLVAGASTFVPGAVRRLLRGTLGVGLLMTIAAVGAVLLGHIGEAAALAFLFSIAEALEDRAMDKARGSLRALLDLLPATAIVSRLHGDVTIPARELRELDVLVVRPGDRIATDGVVVSGRSSIDTSAITGESIPVEVDPGDVVAAGSINGGGALQVEATAAGTDNSLTTIVHLVEQAHARKGDRARLADRIAKPLVPAVLLLAAGIALFGVLIGDAGTWTERALVVLVAASPCALAIAVPVTVISAIGAGSRFGLIITSGEAFERLGTVQVVAFDKTGTLTAGRPSVTDVATAAGASREDVLAVAAALEAHSTHPLAAAILAATSTPAPVVDVTEHPGDGITGVLAGVPVRVGSPRWVPAGALSVQLEAMEGAGMTAVVVERGGTVLGVIGILDQLKPEAAETIAELERHRIGTLLLTGDNTRTAHAIASEAGISDVRAEQKPADKAASIEQIRRHRRVAMIGDGINDAPALASADVGIALGATGSAAAIESADVAFTGTDLRLIPAALLHARRGRRIMTANLLLALGVIVVLFPLALTGVLGLAGVVLVHELAEVVIIANGVRAARRATAPRAPVPMATPARPVPTTADLPGRAR